ncbi:hypothetical protein L083_8076 [Actinoplanes sp. N902-109]|nr:hypothetical protein L083_8076 [Actinoplanes sp. N902-109]
MRSAFRTAAIWRWAACSAVAAGRMTDRRAAEREAGRDAGRDATTG